MEAVIETIDLDSQEMEVIFKHWSTKDTKDADITKDFPYQYLLKSKSKSLIFWVSLTSQIFVDMLYDSSDQELEQWVISTNHKLRTKFGHDRIPIFKVLSRKGGDFFTENVRTEGFEADIYNYRNKNFNPAEKGRIGFLK